MTKTTKDNNEIQGPDRSTAAQFVTLADVWGALNDPKAQSKCLEDDDDRLEVFRLIAARAVR